MATGTIIVLVIVLVIVVAAAVAGTMLMRRRALRRRFGPEYDQLASKVGERQAQTQLSERQRRVQNLHIRPLSAEQRAGYSREWMSIQEQFIDSPAQAVQAAGRLVSTVAADRGYPANNEEELLADLSVHHANRLDGYRRARAITAGGQAGTEDLRAAMLGYRELFEDLTGADPTVDGSPAAAGGATVQPTVGEPGTVQPTTVQPTTVQPTTVQPAAGEPAVDPAASGTAVPAAPPGRHAAVRADTGSEVLADGDPATAGEPIAAGETDRGMTAAGDEAGIGPDEPTATEAVRRER